jgi:hypothetical protein
VDDPMRARTFRLRRKPRTKFTSSGCILSILHPAEVAAFHELVEYDATRAGPDAKQAARLIEVQAQARHLSIHSDNHRDQLGTGRLAWRRSSNLTATLWGPEASLHRLDNSPGGACACARTAENLQASRRGSSLPEIPCVRE